MSAYQRAALLAIPRSWEMENAKKKKLQKHKPGTSNQRPRHPNQQAQNLQSSNRKTSMMKASSTPRRSKSASSLGGAPFAISEADSTRKVRTKTKAHNQSANDNKENRRLTQGRPQQQQQQLQEMPGHRHQPQGPPVLHRQPGLHQRNPRELQQQQQQQQPPLPVAVLDPTMQQIEYSQLTTFSFDPSENQMVHSQGQSYNDQETAQGGPPPHRTFGSSRSNNASSKGSYNHTSQLSQPSFSSESTSSSASFSFRGNQAMMAANQPHCQQENPSVGSTGQRNHMQHQGMVRADAPVASAGMGSSQRSYKSAVGFQQPRASKQGSVPSSGRISQQQPAQLMNLAADSASKAMAPPPRRQPSARVLIMRFGLRPTAVTPKTSQSGILSSSSGVASTSSSRMSMSPKRPDIARLSAYKDAPNCDGMEYTNQHILTELRALKQKFAVFQDKGDKLNATLTKIEAIEKAIDAKGTAAAEVLDKVEGFDATIQERKQAIDRKSQEFDEKHAAAMELAVKAEETRLLVQKEGRERMDACASLEAKAHGHTVACASLEAKAHGHTVACASLEAKAHDQTEEFKKVRDETLKACEETKTWAQRAIDAVQSMLPSFLGGKRSDNQVPEGLDQRDGNVITQSPSDGSKPNRERKRKVTVATKGAEPLGTTKLMQRRSKRLKSTPTVIYNVDVDAHKEPSSPKDNPKTPCPKKRKLTSAPAVERITRKKTSDRRGIPSRSTSVTTTKSSTGSGQSLALSPWSLKCLDASPAIQIKEGPSTLQAVPLHNTANQQSANYIKAMPAATTKWQLDKTLTRATTAKARSQPKTEQPVQNKVGIPRVVEVSKRVSLEVDPVALYRKKKSRRTTKSGKKGSLSPTDEELCNLDFSSLHW